MIIVSSIYYDIAAIKWTTKRIDATIETEREKIIEEYGQPYREFYNENRVLNMVYDSYNTVMIMRA